MACFKNLDIRSKIAESNLNYWEIAQELGISDSTFSRKLRKEFSKKYKKKILQIIDNLNKNTKK